MGVSTPPIEPDADEARELVRDELTESRYQTSDADGPPDWLEKLIEAIRDWLASLGGDGGSGGAASGWLAVLVVVAIALVVVAFLVFGVPRLRAHSAASDDAVFEADDRRDAAAMRRAAEAAAATGDFATAIAERFRAIARRLHERALVSTVPGSTAHDVARRAGSALPEHANALDVAAHDFDAVRYLGNAGDRARYERIAELDTALARARPRTELDTDHVDRDEFARGDG